ncbi:MAG: hypothetical protein WBM32_16590, partial [Crocosphaera sp.]
PLQIYFSGLKLMASYNLPLILTSDFTLLTSDFMNLDTTHEWRPTNGRQITHFEGLCRLS